MFRLCASALLCRAASSTTSASASAAAASPLTGSASGSSSGLSTTGPSPPTARTEPWECVQGLLVSAKRTHPRDVFSDRPLALGKITEKVSHTRYRVRFAPPSPTANGGPVSVPQPDGAVRVVAPPLTLDAGTRVKIFFGERSGDARFDMLMGGVIVKINGDATYTMLMSNDELELAVSPEQIAEVGAQTKVLHSARFVDLVEWLQPTVTDARDCEAIAYILYCRGWRVDRMYLLDKSDLASFVFVTRLEREAVMERARWERDHHTVVRLLLRERLKDRDFRYAVSKYKGTISCIAGILVVTYVFLSNLSAYRKQQRAYQLELAVQTLNSAGGSHKKKGGGGSGAAGAGAGTGRGGGAGAPTHTVSREEEEKQVRDVLRRLDPTHPRIVVFTGFAGCGKSVLTRAALEKEHMRAIHVDIRGSEDTLRSVVKALGVQNIDVCGDLLDFVAEALQMSMAVDRKHRIPVVSIKLREGSSLERVYREAVGLVSDRQVCHLILEVPLESLTPHNVALPRLDFHVLPDFNLAQAFEYTQHRIDPLDVLYFTDVVGTNSNDLDELYAAVHQREVNAVDFTALKLMKAMRRVYAACDVEDCVRDAIAQLVEPSFEAGLTDESVETDTIPVLEFLASVGIVMYDAVQDRWVFTHKVLHTAARCCW